MEPCTDVIASDADVYCRHCKLYWEDVRNGLFFDDPWEDKYGLEVYND